MYSSHCTIQVALYTHVQTLNMNVSWRARTCRVSEFVDVHSSAQRIVVRTPPPP